VIGGSVIGKRAKVPGTGFAQFRKSARNPLGWPRAHFCRLIYEAAKMNMAFHRSPITEPWDRGCENRRISVGPHWGRNWPTVLKSLNYYRNHNPLVGGSNPPAATNFSMT
jgi:hypothetical protein